MKRHLGLPAVAGRSSARVEKRTELAEPATRPTREAEALHNSVLILLGQLENVELAAWRRIPARQA